MRVVYQLRSTESPSPTSTRAEEEDEALTRPGPSLLLLTRPGPLTPSERVLKYINAEV